MRYALGLLFFAAAIASGHAQTLSSDVEYLLGECSVAANERMCNANHDEFISDYRLAFKKDYQAQRNVAFCLIDGCDGAVKINKPLGCAWRIVILASGSQKLDASDRMNYDIMCKGKLDNTEALVFEGQAQELFRAIYKKKLTIK